MRNVARRIGQTEVIETPPLYLPWTQRVLNPFPLASSGTAWGDSGQPWPALMLAFYCSVFVSTTNSAASFWTIDLKDVASTVLASFNTSAIAANTWTRFAVTTGMTQPGTTNPIFTLVPTKGGATSTPGSIYIAPAVALLRTG